MCRFERGEKTPYMQATQQAVLHVARQLKASSRSVSESNALCTVWDTFVSFLKVKGLSPEDDAADWSLHHRITSYNVCYTKLLREECSGRGGEDG